MGCEPPQGWTSPCSRHTITINYVMRFGGRALHPLGGFLMASVGQPMAKAKRTVTVHKPETARARIIAFASRLKWVPPALLIAIFGLWLNVQGDRANVFVSGVEFDPAALVADKPIRIAIGLKNSGKNFGAIDGAATDRVDKLPGSPIYDVANITPTRIAGGGELRLISDLGAPR
jgi:hypothetical protein